ncbi:GL20756 [Drosophila persimilis]|uniref:GL20756 n=2 Tax=Drosophila persimilis TaxID=7234 RepID=B4H410_DROPE|nr:GL20756 [Drosophila persimilis]
MILTWPKLGILLALALLYALHWAAISRDTLLPTGDNCSLASLEVGYCQSICWLLCQLTPCPFMSLLVLGLMARYLYYAVFLVCGNFVGPRQRHAIRATQISHRWCLTHRASSTAECLLMDIRLEGETGTPRGDLDPPPVQPKPPPRKKRLQTPKPPVPNSHTSCRNPFGSTLQCTTEDPNTDLYRILRPNLQRALDGLQKPLPLPVPAPVAHPLPLYLPHLDELPPVSQSENSTVLEKMKPRPKLLRGILSRLGSSSTKGPRDKDSSSSSLFQPLWQRLRHRSTRKMEASASAFISSCSSSSDESRFMYTNEERQRMAWKSSYTYLKP